MLAVVKKYPKPGIVLNVAELPPPGPHEVLIKVAACGICGSDLGLYQWNPPYHSREPYLPFVVGHEVAGYVVEAGSNVKAASVGDHVTCLPTLGCGQCYDCRSGSLACRAEGHRLLGFNTNGTMAEFAVLPEVNLCKVPDGLTDECAALVEPSSVSLHGVDRSSFVQGESAAIFGPGPIGLLGLLALKALTPKFVAVIGVAQDKKTRLPLADELGADLTVNADVEDPVAILKEKTAGRGVDVVFLMSGSKAAFSKGFQILRRGGRLVVVGIADPIHEINGPALVLDEKTILGSYGQLWTTWIRSLDLLSKNSHLFRKIISHRFPLKEAEGAFRLAAETKEPVKIMLLP